MHCSAAYVRDDSLDLCQKLFNSTTDFLWFFILHFCELPLKVIPRDCECDQCVFTASIVLVSETSKREGKADGFS